ncbi:rCG62004 [Rattus norvegicus]|uniref:RCG62004 n=1 Tax=Rattus norvegicus TaxID=10116 RepID=A6H9N5_RAT|nr:rCG62004 [Rattus norvegicus]
MTTSSLNKGVCLPPSLLGPDGLVYMCDTGRHLRYVFMVSPKPSQADQRLTLVTSPSVHSLASHQLPTPEWTQKAAKAEER